MRLTRERKPKGSRHQLRLFGAVALGGAASWGSWKAPELGSDGRATLGLAVLLAIASGLVVRAWWHRVPFDLCSRMPRRLSVRVRMGWFQRPFLGWTVSFLGTPRWAMGTVEDSVGVVGPPGVNKTAGIGISQVLTWGGPLVSVSQTPVIQRATRRRRRSLAKRHGGGVVIYAPTEPGKTVEGLKPLHFSPGASKDPTEVGLRVDSWMAASATAKGIQDEDHFRAGASAILRGCLLACAHHQVEPGNFRLVRGWLSNRDLSEPIQILRGLNSGAGDSWAAELEGIQNSPAEREREGFFSSALTTIAATANPTVLGSMERDELEAEKFLLSCSTLYIVSPTEHQRAVAPLISMLVDTLVRTAYRLHREGRLPARFGLSLDDLANVAPLPSLESIISQGRGQGVNVFWSLQSLAQLVVHYGLHAAEAIWSATRCKLVFGGLTDDLSVKRLSEVLPEERVVLPGESDTDNGRRATRHVTYRRLLSAAQLREIPDGWTLLLYLNLPPRMLRQPLAEKRPQLRHHMETRQPIQLRPIQLARPRRVAAIALALRLWLETL